MAKIEITKTELVWPGKYNEDGTLKEVPRVSLPFQVIETVNESRATREATRRGVQQTLFDVWEGKEGETFEEGWKNKLIWGDNLLVMGSLLEKFAGKIDLIYIDPPFATGADFSFTAPIGESGDEVFKEQSVIEEKAYRDTWGRGLESYLQMLFERGLLIRSLLSPQGKLIIHMGDHVSSYVRNVFDEIFSGLYRNTIIVRRGTKNVQAQFEHVDALAIGCDHLLLYVASEEVKLPRLQHELAEHEPGKWDTFWRGTQRPTMRYNLFGIEPQDGQWRWEEKRARRAVRNYEEYLAFSNINNISLDDYYLEKLINEGLDLDFVRLGPNKTVQYYVPPRGYKLISNVWMDLMTRGTETTYATEKHEQLLERIVNWLSVEGSLIADFFCGSGTTLAVAEKLGRRWIGCDLGRWAIHVTRKRLLSIPDCKPFEILNLGKYERQYWQGVTFGNVKDKAGMEQRLYEYLAFILKLYGAQPVAGMAHLHGKKGKAMVHIGAVDAPVTIAEIEAAVDECVRLKQNELHVLGWEWEMGIAAAEGKGGLMHEAARKRGVKLLLLQIPREVMEQQAAEKGDVRFFELAYFEAKITQPKPLTVQVELADFASPNMDETIPDDVRAKITKWSDYIDYWAIDWDFQHDTFMQGWVAYRTRKERRLPLVSDPHTYPRPGTYRILVKVIDIFGNDTSQAFDVEVR
ncbi:MAG: site-specific DNA-methyltransferase [Candidatus Binatia bacterium]|nr:site-specific DNA-methyltransferase [Candidatus Binatia bacterium]